MQISKRGLSERQVQTMTDLADQQLRSRLLEASAPQRADLLIDYFTTHGGEHYEEEVTQLEHALQTATLARTAGSDSDVVCGALLHDLGHLLVGQQTAAGDFYHEEVAAEYLQSFFGRDVTEPIRLHVPAKRYLCTTDPAYFDGMSDASKKSFLVQGGNMSAEELAQLEASPYLEAALRLRRWDDGGKVCGLKTLAIDDFRADLVKSLQKG